MDTPNNYATPFYARQRAVPPLRQIFGGFFL